MSDAVISALIVTFGTIICQILINRSNREKRVKEDNKKEIEKAARDAEKEARLENRLNNIERKLDEHNNYGRKFETVAAKFTSIAEDLSALKTSIDFIRQ